MPHLATCIFLFSYNEPELGVGIDPGMALTPLPSSIGRGLNPRPSDREPSALPLDNGICLQYHILLERMPLRHEIRYSDDNKLTAKQLLVRSQKLHKYQ